MPSKLHLDFETQSAVDLKACGADVYARDFSTRVMAAGYAFDDEDVKVLEIYEAPPKRILDHIQSGGAVYAHNAVFEWLIYNHCWRRYFNLPWLFADQLHCTMVQCYAMGLPGSLDKAAPALGLDIQKDMKGNRVMLQLSQPREIKPDGTFVWWSPIEHEDKYQRMYEYCAQDIKVEREIDKRTLPLSTAERDMWILDHKINQRGVCVDIESAYAAIEIVNYEQQRLNQVMREITGNEVASTNAHSQLSTFLRNRGVKTEGVAKSDVTDLLAQEDLPEDCRRALQIRQEAAKSSTAKFNSLIQRTNREDNRMRSTLQYHGAGTGRWAGRGFQLHNLPRPKLTEKEIEGVFNELSNKDGETSTKFKNQVRNQTAPSTSRKVPNTTRSASTGEATDVFAM